MDTSMMDTTKPALAETSTGFSRRSLLRGSVTLGLAAMIGSLTPLQSVFAAEVSAADFIALSQFLISRPVNPVLASRYHAALTKRAPNFAGNVIALNDLIRAQGYKHVDEYLAQAQPDASLKATATSIIAAWYLGIVGELADAELISYSEAAMYQPTQGILAIPTYGGGPASWGPKSAVIQDSKV